MTSPFLSVIRRTIAVVALVPLLLTAFLSNGCRREPTPAESAAIVPAIPSARTTTARITGRVSLRGIPPPEVEMPLDPSCGKLHTTRPKTRNYLIDASGGLADVFVHVTHGATGGTVPPPDAPVVIDQKDCLYIPFVIGAQTRQTIRVKNSDPLMHNVHPMPTVAGNREYNRAQLPKGPDLDFAWENPEVLLRFKCDVHPWMYAYIGLVGHPFHAVTATDGTFTLPELPPGKYVVEAYHRRAGRATQEITLEAGETKPLEFTLAAPGPQ